MPFLILSDKSNIFPKQPITSEAEGMEILATLERKYPKFGDKIRQAKNEGYDNEEIETGIMGLMLSRKQKAIEAGYNEEEINEKIKDLLFSPPAPDITQSFMRGISGSVGSTVKGVGKLVGKAGALTEDFAPTQSLGTKLGKYIEQVGEYISPEPLTKLQEEERGRLGKYTEMGANVAADIGSVYMPLSAATQGLKIAGKTAQGVVKAIPESATGILPDFIRKYAPKIIEETPHLAAVFGGAAGIKSGGSVKEMAEGAAIAPLFSAATIPASKILKAIFSGSIGYGQSQLEGADTDETIFNTALMAAFGALSPSNKNKLIEEIKENPNKPLGELPAGKKLLALSSGELKALPAGENPPTQTPKIKLNETVPEKLAKAVGDEYTLKNKTLSEEQEIQEISRDAVANPALAAKGFAKNGQFEKAAEKVKEAIGNAKALIAADGSVTEAAVKKDLSILKDFSGEDIVKITEQQKAGRLSMLKDKDNEVVSRGVNKTEKAQGKLAIAPEPVEGKPEVPTTDIQGRPIQEEFIKLVSPKELKILKGKSPHEAYKDIPKREGWDVVYKPYGEKGRGFYYHKVLTEKAVAEGKLEAPPTEAMKQPEPLIKPKEAVNISDIETPVQGSLNSAIEAKKTAWKQIVKLREQIKNEPLGGNRQGLRLELIKWNDKYKQAMSAEQTAKMYIERRANELGQTISPEAVKQPETSPSTAPYSVGDRVVYTGAQKSPQVRVVKKIEDVDPNFPEERFVTLENERTGEIEKGVSFEQIKKVKPKMTTLELGGLQSFYDKYFSGEKAKVKETGDVEFDYKEHLEGKKPSNIIENTKNTINEFTGIISTELKSIHPDIKTFTRRNFFNTAINISRDEVKAKPFIDKSSKLPEHIRGELSEALMNGDTATANAIAQKYGLEKEINVVRVLFADIYKKAANAGIDIGYIKDYWSRIVRDPEGLLSTLHKTKDWSFIDKLIKEKEAKNNVTLTDAEKAIIADNFLRGYPQGIGLGTKSVKTRTIKQIPKELLKFYMPADEGLIPYIRNMNKAIGVADFFGKNKKLDIDPELITNTDIDKSIGDYIIRLKEEGKIKAKDELKLRDLLQAYLQPTHASYGVRAYKNLTYLTTLSHISPILTQIGDLPLVVEELGYVQTTKSLGKVIANRLTRTKSEITPKDIAIESVMEELKGGEDTLGRYVKKALTGFSAVDRIPKEVVLNGKLSLMRKQAIANDPKLIKDITELLGKEKVEQTLKDLKTNNVTDDTLFTLFNTLSDIQPISALEVPQKYHQTNWGKTFYALKTYQLKLLDVYRNKVYDKIKNGDREEKIEGLKNFTRLTTSLVLLNAGIDEVKDFINGRKTDFSDRVIDNILKLGGFSRYTLWKTREEGIGKGLLTQFAPPLGVFDAALLDVTKPDDKGLRVTRYIPIAGEQYYWWLGRGSEISKKKELEKNKELLKTFNKREWKNPIKKSPFGRKYAE